MYDPIKLAEDLNVLDHLSRGRVTPIIGLGYRPEEFAMFGVDPARRGAEMEERLEVLQAALTGETVTWRGRTATVRPRPYTEGGVRLAYGGGSPAAARRAARFGLDFIGEADRPELADAYAAEAERVGPGARGLHGPVGGLAQLGVRGRGPRRGVGHHRAPPPPRRPDVRRLAGGGPRRSDPVVGDHGGGAAGRGGQLPDPHARRGRRA